jgi:hypothetical protein
MVSSVDKALTLSVVAERVLVARTAGVERAGLVVPLRFAGILRRVAAAGVVLT